MNEIKEIKKTEVNKLQDLSKEQELVVKWLENWETIYPNLKPERARQLAMGFAYCLSQVKVPNGASPTEYFDKGSMRMAFEDVMTKQLDLRAGQGALIPTGNKITLFCEYFGNVAMAKRAIPNLEITSVAVYQGEKVVFKQLPNHVMDIIHTPSYEARKKGIIEACYAVASIKKEVNRKVKKLENGIVAEEYEETATIYEVIASEFMNANELRNAHLQSRNGISVHQKFTHEMGRKTVENRLAKHIWRKAVGLENETEVETPTNKVVYEVDNVNFDESKNIAENVDESNHEYYASEETYNAPNVYENEGVVVGYDEEGLPIYETQSDSDPYSSDEEPTENAVEEPQNEVLVPYSDWLADKQNGFVKYETCKKISSKTGKLENDYANGFMRCKLK